MHPEVYVRTLTWNPARGAACDLRNHDLRQSPMYRGSPVERIHQGSGPIRCRLVGPDADLSFPVCRDIVAEGGTDYLVLPVELAGTSRSFASFATARPGGFTDAQLDALASLVPLLSLRLAHAAARFATRGLLEVYLGKNAARRVLSGAFTRGGGETLHAAIWFCDLRGFTALSDSRPAAEMVALLDRYFEAVAGPIDDAGGEILKFIGDAVLAIFPVGAAGPGDACDRALAAARRALAGVAALDADGGPLSIGIALHLGEVLYGNIGGRDRLDFTVIGPAVNEASRVESLCKEVGASILVTSRFAAALPDVAFDARGEHRLRGVAAPQPLYTPTGS
jgi:adenylate cyclase